MRFFDDIFSLVWDIAGWFRQLYYDSYDIPFVGPVISNIFYWIYQAFWNLLTPIAQFGDWVDDVALKVSNILSQADILSLLRTWLTYGENAWGWVVNALQNVTGIVNAWWSSTSQTVQMWVSEAKQYAASLVAVVNMMLTNLQAAWDSFKGKIPTLDVVIAWWGNFTANILLVVNNWWKDRLLDVQGLINSTLKTWFPFYDDLVKLWGSIALFFTDPEDWLYKAVDRIIERFW